MAEHDSPGDANLGAATAASGEVSIFSYDRDSFEPMYYGTIGVGERFKIFTGYSVKGLRSADADEAFSFICEGIDAGQGVFVAGPEIGLCYGYEDPGSVEERKVYGVSNWGPAFDGTYSWERFSEHVRAFGNAEGFGYLHRESGPGALDDILSTFAVTVVDWQEHHIATQFGMKQESYGLTAFRHFIEDVRDPEIRLSVEGVYLNCHAIGFQVGGRYWLGQYLQQLSHQADGSMQKRLTEIGDLYTKVHSELRRFQEFDITDGRNEDEVQDAVRWLEGAYRADELILDAFVSLKEEL